MIAHHCSSCGLLTNARGQCRECITRSEKARGSASKRGYGYRWQAIRAAQLEREPDCVVCGEPATDVDHITPREMGGSDEPSNLQSMCHAHHSAKTARQSSGWGRT